MTDLTTLSDDALAASFRQHLVEANRRLDPTGYIRVKDRLNLVCLHMREIGKQLIADALISPHSAGRCDK